MHTHIIAVGERMPGWVADGYAEYARRLSRTLPLQLVEVRSGMRGKGGDTQRATDDEGRAVLAALPKATHAVALDGGGKSWSSEQLAAQLSDWRMSGRGLAFLIGGADGHAQTVLDRADQRWSLGALTLPHMLVRLILVEQLYRAAMIVAGHPYHRA